MLNPNRFPSVYDELISFYPDYYLRVKEMQAILRAQGTLADGLVSAIDLIVDNNFIESAHLDMIERLETFLGISPMSNDMDERRQYIMSYFIGFGHISASSLIRLIKTFTQEDSSVSFNLKDNNSNYILEISIKKKHGVNPDWETLYRLIDNRIPAHISMLRDIVFPSPNLPLHVGFSIRSTENVGEFTVPDFDFSTINVLVMPNGDWLTMPNGDILYYERTDDEE